MPFEVEEQAALAADPQSRFVNDYSFIVAVRRLKSLRTFMQQSGVAQSVDIGGRASSLYTLRYGQEGRPPAADEWQLVDTLTEDSLRLMPESLRRKFFLGEIPAWMSIAPLCLAVLALMALVGAVFSLPHHAILMLPCYLVWLMCLGAIGSAAFIGMNALSVQQDVTFDLSNARLMILRIVLGALFGLVLTLPFGFPEFYGFIRYLNDINGDVAIHLTASDAETKIAGISSRALALLMPFVLGFSTSLVIMILNRLVDAVQAFFGKQTESGSNSPSVSRVAGYSAGYGSGRASVSVPVPPVPSPLTQRVPQSAPPASSPAV